MFESAIIVNACIRITEHGRHGWKQLDFLGYQQQNRWFLQPDRFKLSRRFNHNSLKFISEKEIQSSYIQKQRGLYNWSNMPNDFVIHQMTKSLGLSPILIYQMTNVPEHTIHNEEVFHHVETMYYIPHFVAHG